MNIQAKRTASYSWAKTTDITGYYTMTVAAGTFTVTPTAPGYGTASVFPVNVITDSVTLQNFVQQYIPSVAFAPETQTKIGEPGTQVIYVYTVTNDAHVEQEISLDLQSYWPTQASSR